VLAVTDPDAAPHERMSMFVFPVNTPGVEIVRNVGVFGHSSLQGDHSYVRYNAVRLPSDALLGKRGRGFEVAQTRLGGGRIHHAMRTVAQVKRAFDMMCERALSRETKGGLLADKQLVQAMIAESWIQWQQFRLLVLRTAWRIDKYNDYSKVRSDIAAVKIMMPKVLHDIASRALQIHGSLGVSVEMPFGEMIMDSYVNGLADGPTEVHQMNLARQLLKDYSGTAGLFPKGHLPARRQAALEKFADVLAEVEQEQALKGATGHAPA
jgi:acyl-CoA dehydrogenase